MVDKAGGVYEENAVTGNSGDGFYLRNAATPETRGNEFARNEGTYSHTHTHTHTHTHVRAK